MGELQTAATELVEVNLGDIGSCPNDAVNDAEDNINSKHNIINKNDNVSNTNKSNEDRKDIFRNGSINHNNIINNNENINKNNMDNIYNENTNNNNSSNNENTNNNNNSNTDNSYNRFSSDSSQLTTSSKKPMISNKKELKQLRKPSDRIQSKSYCATFCYNIPRSSLMITIPGFVILATGAILIAAADRNVSWTDGGMPLVSLVFLIVGGFWTLGGLIYWLITWCKYKPNVVKRSETSTRPVMTSSATSSSAFNNGYPSNNNIPLSITPSTSTPTVFETVNSPFTVIPHPIFSQQQLRQSQEIYQNQQPIADIHSQQIQYHQNPSKFQSAQQTYSENIQQEVTRQQQNARQTSQQLQQNLSNHQQNIREEVFHLRDDVTNSVQQQQRIEDRRYHNLEENLNTSFYY